MQNSYAFMKEIRGTTAYWKDQLYALLAKINFLGPPTFFLTFTANELGWPELFMMIDPTLTEVEVCQMPAAQKWQMVKDNQIIAALHFHRRTRGLLKYLMSKNSLLGKVKDYWVRFEFQMRGSPHIHMFTWIDGAPDLDTVQGRREAPTFIDKYISTVLSPETDSELLNLVKSLQIHHHTHTCLKRGTSCRFHFPKPVSAYTCVKENIDITTSAQFYVTKRTEADVYVNAYNPQLLKLWKANSDIQMVGSKYGAAYYVCMYISKSEPANLREAITKCVQSLPTTATKRQQLARIGSTVLSHRTISIQEVAFRLCGLPLVLSTRETVWVNSNQQDKRQRILKPKEQLKKLPFDSSDIFLDGIIQYYSLRPGGSMWDKMCLATFASSYRISSKASSSAIKLKSIEKWIIPRRKPACVRTPYIIPSMGDKYYYHILFLFMPWRQECELSPPEFTVQEYFLHCQPLIDKSSLEFQSFQSDINRAVQQIQLLESLNQLFTGDHIGALDLDVTSHLQNATSAVDVNFDTSDDDNVVESLPVPNLANVRITDADFYSSLQNLSSDQKKCIDIIQNHFKLQMHSNNEIEPLHLFVTGSGGSGKSYVI